MKRQKAAKFLLIFKPILIRESKCGAIMVLKLVSP